MFGPRRGPKAATLASALLAGAVVAILLCSSGPPNVDRNSGARAQVQFNWPYSYGTPVVPAGVGAQGSPGLTVPQSQVGPLTALSAIGTSGHLGPVNLSGNGVFQKVASTLEVQVFNGTTGSSVASSKSTVKLENLTYGTSKSATTNSNGFVNITTTEGEYFLYITSQGVTFTNFTQTLFISTASLFIKRYLLPVTGTTTTINNCGASQGTCTMTIFVSQRQSIIDGGSAINPFPQINVTLYNQSIGPTKVLATVYTKSNGTAVFTQVNTAYSYYFFFWGWSQPQSAVRYSMGNVTDGAFTPSGGQTKAVLNYGGFNPPQDQNGLSKTTGTLTGTALPAYANWVIAANTQITGGVTYISGGIAPTQAYWYLSFYNALVFYNNSVILPTMNFRFVNSTLISYSQYGGLYQQTSSWFNNSVIIGSYLLAGSAQFPGENQYAPKNAANSIVKDLVASANIPRAGGNYTNVMVENFTTNGNPVFLSQLIYKSTIQNTTFSIDQSHSLMNMSRIQNSSMTEPSAASWVNFVGDEFGPNVTANDWINLIGLNYGNVTRCLFTTSMVLGEIFNTVAATHPTYDVQFGTNETISQNWFNYSSMPALTPTYTIYFNDVAKNNVFDSTVPLSVRDTWTSNARHNLSLPMGFAQIAVHITNHARLTNSIDKDALVTFTGGSFSSVDNTTVFSQPIDVMTASATGASGRFDNFTNDSFYGGSVNKSYIIDTTCYSNGCGSLGGLTVSWVGAKTILVNYIHDTFRAFGGGYATPQEIIFDGGSSGLSNMPGNVTYVLFTNDNSSGPNAFFSSPYAADLWLPNLNESAAFHLTVAHSWFLNLNQGTVPVFSTGGRPETPRINMTDDHMFWNPGPLPGVPNVPVIRNGPGGTITYALTLFKGVSLTQSSESNLIFNQSGSFSFNGATEYYYGVAPDVNVSAGPASVSFQNGFAGGPQPNFFWHGYNYTEMVETQQIAIGVNSTNAPGVNLQFVQLAPGAIYNLGIYGSDGSLFASQTVNAGLDGTYTAGYDPSRMPLSAVFVMTAVPSHGGGCVGSQCTVVQPGPGFNCTGSILCQFRLPNLSLPSSQLILIVVTSGFIITGLVIVPGGGKRSYLGLSMIVIGTFVGLVLLTVTSGH